MGSQTMLHEHCPNVFHETLVPQKVKWSEVAQLCLTLCDPMDCSLPASSVYGISRARILEWVAISFSGDFLDTGIEPGTQGLNPHLLHRKQILYSLSHQRNAISHSFQFSRSVVCDSGDPMSCSTPGLPVQIQVKIAVKYYATLIRMITI